MDSKEAVQEKEMDPLPLLRNAFLADTPLHVGRSDHSVPDLGKKFRFDYGIAFSPA